MNAELIGIPRRSVVLGGLVLAVQIRTDKRLDAFGDQPDGRSGPVERRMTRLKGLTEGTG